MPDALPQFDGLKTVNSRPNRSASVGLETRLGASITKREAGAAGTSRWAAGSGVRTGAGLLPDAMGLVTAPTAAFAVPAEPSAACHAASTQSRIGCHCLRSA